MDLVATLAGIVGPRHVLVDPDQRRGHEVDWTGRYRGTALAVVRPGSTDEVAEVLARCRRAGVAVVPQGGNTGLVGGSVPVDGGVVVSTTRLDAIGPVDRDAGQVTVGAGTTLAAVQRAAAAAGWAYGVDFGARDAATIGGTIATNAGGHHVLRFGSTRRQVIGVEAVLADGRRIARLHGLVKDNTGYDLAGLLCGSEGTLAVLTAARLALVPAPGARTTALVGLESTAAAVAAVGRLRRQVPGLEAVELMLAAGIALVAEHLGRPPPFAPLPPAALLVEAEGPGAESALAAALADAGPVLVATDSVRRAALWRWRDAHTEAIATLGVPHKLDVTLPAAELARFLDDVAAAVHEVQPRARSWLFGHAGDGNIHVNVTGSDPDDPAVDDAVLALVLERGGSISAEHGIGRAKAAWLARDRSPEEVDVMRSVKRAFDPDGILNPGVLWPADQPRGTEPSRG